MRTTGTMRVAACTACGVLAAVLIVSARQDGSPRLADPPTALEAPWPDAAALEARRLASEGLPLFGSEDVLSLQLTADFSALQKDRDPESTRRFPGTVAVATAEGRPGAPVAVTLATRGRNRLKHTTCDFPPLRIRFERASVAGTVFAGQSSLKLVTHCRDTPAYAAYLQQEYLAYRVFALHTPWSFRVRMARITYVEASSGRRLFTRPALVLEDVDDVARRNGGRAVDLERVPYARLDLESTTRLALVQYLIANTDYGFVIPHNIAIVQVPTGRLVPVAYDFDMSGLVNTGYAGVNRAFGLASVRERLYRGPCRPIAELEPLLAEMRQQQSAVMALYDAPGLDRAYVRHARQLLERFYETISRPDRIRKAFIDGCGRHLAA